ncbi:MAG: hypothetical protein ACTSPD_13585 [Promethearchaeota archaeon]
MSKRKSKNSIFGQVFNIINEWKYNKKEYNHLNQLLKFTKKTNLLNKTIIFNTIRNFKSIIDREFFLGKILALSGAKVIMLLDDGILKHWDTYQIDTIPNLQKIKKFNLNPYKILNTKNPKYYILHFLKRNIINKALKTYKDENLRIIYYSSFLSKKENNDSHGLEKFAISSTMRFFKTSKLDYNDIYIKYIYELSLENAVLSRAVGEFIKNEIQPDFFITSHGIYSTWGPAYEYLKQEGIKSLVYAGKLSHSMDIHDIYFTDSKVQTLTRSTFWKNYKNTPVTKAMEDKVKELFETRMRYSTKDTNIYYKGKLNIFKVDKNDGYKYHIAIFPSLIWDGNIQDRHIAFKGVIDWLISTIDYFKNRKNVKIFLKFHPAEVTMFRNVVIIQDLIKEYLESNKIDNLTLIQAKQKIDTYEFLKSGINLGICYDGFLALELPLMKIPVILGGVDGRFSIEGGNFTVKNQKDYFNYLENFEKLIEEFHENYEKYYKNIIRYAYWYLFENPIKLPTLTSKDLYKTDLLQLKKEDLILDEKLKNLFI